MQTKTIKKVINTKMDEWLKSINDDSLREDLRKELLVSGGSITSMFLKEDVNDFDIYIETPETVFRLCLYYINKYKLNEKVDIQVFLGKDRDTYMNEHNFHDDDESRYGGIKRIFIENLKPEQVKIWTGKDTGFATELEPTDEDPYVPVYLSPNAISLSNKVQIVTRFTGDHNQIHKNFDFIHATNYFTMKDGLVTNIEALESILTKTLKYQGSLYPLTSIIRTKKFINRGWKISAGEYLKMMFQVSLLDLTDLNVLEEQLAGIDVAYFQMLVDALRKMNHADIDGGEEQPDFVLTYPYLAKMIDRIFGDEDIDEIEM